MEKETQKQNGFGGQKADMAKQGILLKTGRDQYQFNARFPDVLMACLAPAGKAVINGKVLSENTQKVLVAMLAAYIQQNCHPKRADDFMSLLKELWPDFDWSVDVTEGGAQ